MLLTIDARARVILSCAAALFFSISRAASPPDSITTFLLAEGGGRLDSLVIEGDHVEVKTLKEGLSVPTGVATAGRTAWISEGQLALLFDPTQKGQQPKLPFRLYSVGF